MTKKSLYEVLQVSQDASSEIISDAYSRLKNIYTTQFDNGDVEAKNKLTILQETYNILRSPERRKYYDDSQSMRASGRNTYAGRDNVIEYKQESVFLEFWNGSVTSKLLVAIVFFGILFGIYKFVGQDKSHKNTTARIDNDAELIDGVVRVQEGRVKNEDTRIEKSYAIADKNAETRRIEVESQAKAREESLAQSRRIQEENIKRAELRREQYEKLQSEREARTNISREKQALCHIYLSNSRYAEARESGCYSR